MFVRAGVPTTIGTLGCRLFSTKSRVCDIATIAKCPPPKFDTGCTYCECSDPNLVLKSPPESIRNTAPPLNKIIIYKSNDKDFSNWPKKVETASPVMQNMSKIGRGNGNMIVLSSLPHSNPKSDISTFRVYPDSKDVSFDSTSEKECINFFANLDTINNMPMVENIDKTTVLICAHLQRDQRCGVLGSMIYNEFEKCIQLQNLEDKIDLAYVSHVGGHLYAGNVIILKNDGTVFWYGMVRPNHVQGLIENSILNNIHIEELSRK